MNTRINLRKILGYDEAVAGFERQANRPRALGGRGVAWFDGHGENGKVPTAAEEEEAEKEKKAVGTQSGGTGTKRGDESIDEGNEIRGITDLRDCETGKCINVRLDGNALPPDGWESACKPPAAEQPDCLMQMHFYDSYKKTSKTVVVSDADAAFAATIEFYEGSGYHVSHPYPDSSNWEAQPNGTLIITPIKNPDGSWGDSGYIQATLNRLRSIGCNPVAIGGVAVGSKAIYRVHKRWPNANLGTAGHMSATLQKTAKRGTPEYDAMLAEKKPKWPEGTCSELPATPNGFTSCGTDPNLAAYRAGQKQITLCDKDGNKVRITQTATGFEVWQQKTGKTAKIDGQTFKATSVSP